ncbi:AIPR family protein [Skermanella sp. TT6]|uniref:AIPR family protein n=1 Tax=Skermanella cutis TaxID=2775420 RepID=A0ABX7BF24_9PROT|nr:AIPR family protein [Skermanella sp. TT6]QQP91666.1 AIPR family protein [Skermanella sp. TT6]
MSKTFEAGWEKAFKVMKDNYSLTDDAIGVFAINLRFNLDDIQTISSESITGGGDDKKCDVLYVDKERQVAVIAQCYISKRIRESAPANKASDLNTAITWLLSTNLDLLPDNLKGRADELRSAINSGEIKQIYIWYVHNLPGSKNVKDELRAVENAAKVALKSYHFGQDINIFAEEVCEAQLERLYTQAERTVIVTDEITTTVPDAVEIKETDWQSVVTVVNGKWIHDLYHQYKTDLFSANLRAYLGSRESDSHINNGIKTTAQEQPSNFYVYNNGITALVLDYELGKRSKNGRRLKIVGISIVNGAQTTGSIANLEDVPPKSLQVPIRFVKATKDGIVENVVRYNNSQNKLQAADFRSTDQIQERLRTEFESIPDAEYEGGRRGGASDAIKRSKFTLPSYTVGQSLAAFHGDPVTAYDKKSELWTNEKNYRHIFTDRTTARHIVFCYSLLSAINDQKLELTQRHKKDPSSLTNVENTSLGFLNKKGSNYLLLHVISQCMETILSKSIPNRFDLQFINNVSPSTASNYWLPIVSMMLSLSNQLDNAFSRNRISNESVSKTVPNFVGVVASISTLQKENFEKFAAYTRIGL